MPIDCTMSSISTGGMRIEDEVEALPDIVDDHRKTMGVARWK